MRLLHRLRRPPARESRETETLLAHAAALALQVARIAEAVRDLDDRAHALVARERAVERSLLRSSEALDGRQAALDALARELRDREAAVAARERETGGRAAALEERDRELAAREEQLAARAAERDARDARAVAEQLALRRRADEADRRAAELDERERTAAAPPAPVHDLERSLLLVMAAGGYRLVERAGAPPAPGAALEVGGEVVVVQALGRSPLPDDRRRCALVVPIAAGRNEAAGEELRAS